MLSARRLKFLSLALLLSGGTVVVTQNWLHSAVEKATLEARAKAPAAPAAARRVLVADAAVPAGAILKAEHLRWQAWPAEASTAGYLTDSQTQIDKVAGAVARANLAPGEPILSERIAYPGDRSFLAAVLRPGYRAVTVNVSAASGVAGFVMPGDHVDLVLSRTIEGGAGAKRVFAETVLSDVRVVGIDQKSYDGKKDVVVPQTATLEVTPKGAEVIAVVSEMGKLSLALRSLAAGDGPAVEPRLVTRTSDSEAVGGPATRAAAPARPPPAGSRAAAVDPNAVRVQIVRGSEVVSVGVPIERGGR